VKARKLAPREKRRGVAQRKDTPEILSAPLAGNRTARKLHFFSQKNKKSKSVWLFKTFRKTKTKKQKVFDFSGDFFHKKTKSQKVLTFRIFDFLDFSGDLFREKSKSVRLFGFFDFLTFWIFEFSSFRLFEHNCLGLGFVRLFGFFRLFVFAFFDCSPFRPKKGKLWLMIWQFNAIQNRQQVLKDS